MGAENVLRHPFRASASLLATARHRRVGGASLLGLAGAESLAHLLAWVTPDRGLGELALWPRIPSAPAAAGRNPGG